MEFDVVGVNEIAEMAGVSRQAVVNWRTRSSDFPLPLKDLASGPIFRRSQVRAWLRRNNRKIQNEDIGPSFYPRLRSLRGDDDALAGCIQNLVDNLETAATSSQRPGMLLGKIQSGKTRGFVGAIAEAFDRGYDIALVLTKGTKTLSAQTVSRLSSDFKEFIDEDELIVLDIMNLPGKLTRSELRRKIVIVAKKQVKNLERLIDFVENQAGLQKRKLLLIDDEADLASVRFIKKRGEDEVSQGTISEQIDQLRDLSTEVAFLQVTATPYSLYLQPEDYDDAAGYLFKPKRPAFTQLLPIHGGYVGGDDYFGAFEDDDPRSRLIVEVSEEEQDALRRADQRRISADRVLESSNTDGLRRAIVTFIVAAGIRQAQQLESGDKVKKYSMVIHNDVQKAAHSWQDQVIDWMFQALHKTAETKPTNLKPVFDAAFDDLSISIQGQGDLVPDRAEAFDIFIDALLSGDVVVERVNSDGDVVALLDQNSELRLRTPYNIFVGGNILDRGITIPNLISFYYGRNPRTMQADTVLQHSRMYGNRSRSDLAVTRFYTSRRVFDRLYTINEFENSLREAFHKGAHDQGVVFLQSDPSNGIRPCAPNKIKLSDVVSISPSSMLLPSDFQTLGGQKMTEIQSRLDQLIPNDWRDSGEFVQISKDDAFAILDTIKGSMQFSSVEFEWNAMKALINYYSDPNGLVSVIAETGRELTRQGSGDKSGRSILGTALRRKVLETHRALPTLVLLQQKGGRERGWSAHSFWWPVLAAPTDQAPCVYASKVTS